MSNLDKRGRIACVEASGILEGKRAILSQEAFIKEWIRALRLTHAELRAELPGYVGMVLWGSFVKGYATPASDIDLRIFIDKDKSDQDHAGTPRGVSMGVKEILPYFQRHGLPTEGIKVYRFSWKRLQVNLFETGIDFEPFFFQHFFHIAIGRELSVYRQKILESCEQQGAEGQRKWEKIRQGLFEEENGTFSEEFQKRREALYPLDVQEAKQKFLFLEHRFDKAG